VIGRNQERDQGSTSSCANEYYPPKGTASSDDRGESLRAIDQLRLRLSPACAIVEPIVEDPFYSWNHRPPPRAPAHANRSGQSTRITSPGRSNSATTAVASRGADPARRRAVIGRRFDLRKLTVRWAEEERESIERDAAERPRGSPLDVTHLLKWAGPNSTHALTELPGLFADQQRVTEHSGTHTMQPGVYAAAHSV
jgi:hypothetical protein